MPASQTLSSYIEAFNRSDVDALSQHYASKMNYRQPFLPAPLTSPAEVKAFESAMFSAFSDVRAEIQWVVADGANAAAGVTITAVHTADMPLPDGSVLPATGARITIETAEHITVDDDGKIVDHQRYADPGAMLAQLQAAATTS